jgi:hypothetical protein
MIFGMQKNILDKINYPNLTQHTRLKYIFLGVSHGLPKGFFDSEINQPLFLMIRPSLASYHFCRKINLLF